MKRKRGCNKMVRLVPIDGNGREYNRMEIGIERWLVYGENWLYAVLEQRGRNHIYRIEKEPKLI